MKINVQKTKTMIVSRDEVQVVNITIDGQRVEEVKNFKYLGSNISEDGYNLIDVKSRTPLVERLFCICKSGVQQEERVFDKRWTKQNTKKENGKGIGVASSVVWMRDMDVEKRGNKQIGGTENVVERLSGKRE